MIHRNTEPTQGEARSQLSLTCADRGLCGNGSPRVLAQYLALLHPLLIQATISLWYIKGPAHAHGFSISWKTEHAGERAERLSRTVEHVERRSFTLAVLTACIVHA